MKIAKVILTDDSQLWGMADILKDVLSDKRIKIEIRSAYIQRVMKLCSEDSIKIEDE